MKFILPLVLLLLYIPAIGQYNPRKYHAFDEVKKLVYRSDFKQNRRIQLTDTTHKGCAVSEIQDNKLMLLNNCSEAVYTNLDLPVLYDGNFEIVAEVRIYCGETTDMLRDGFISWAVQGNSYTYNTFAFTSDEFYGFHSRNGKTGRCENKLYRIRHSYFYDTYARYTLRKYGDKYYFFINGRLIGTAPYMKTDGKLLELGAASKAHTLYKLLDVYYLP